MRLRLVPSFNSRAYYTVHISWIMCKILSLTHCVYPFWCMQKRVGGFCRLFFSFCCCCGCLFVSFAACFFKGWFMWSYNDKFSLSFTMLCIEFMSPKSFLCPSNYYFYYFKINENSINYFLKWRKFIYFYCFIGFISRHKSIDYIINILSKYILTICSGSIAGIFEIWKH